jgi:hypothetical protein
LLFAPLPGVAANTVIPAWLGALGTENLRGTETGFTQKSLRQWQRSRPGHSVFTVLSHPADRAWWAWIELLSDPSRRDVLQTLSLSYGVPPDPAHGFLPFLDFLKANLSGRTSLRTLPEWASQSACLDALAGVVHPGLVCREGRLEADLAYLADRAGVAHAPAPAATVSSAAAAPPTGERVRAALRAAYQRDFVAFGFEERDVQAA